MCGRPVSGLLYLLRTDLSDVVAGVGGALVRDSPYTNLLAILNVTSIPRHPVAIGVSKICVSGT